MKNLLNTIVVVLSFAGMASCQDASKAKIPFHVESDDGKPIASVLIKLTVFDHWDASGTGGFGTDVYREESVTTDAGGNASIEFTTPRGEVKYMIRHNEYYPSSGLALNTHDSKLGKWEPWNKPVKIKLYRVLNPIPLYARRVGGLTAIKLPVLGQPVGFDLQVSDWVAPHGRGIVNDVIFVIDGATKDVTQPHDTTLTVSFSNPNDGLILIRDKETHSSLRLPHFAPEEGYLPKYVMRAGVAPEKSPLEPSGYETDAKEGDHFYLRVRTKVDAQGKLISANYGKVCGGADYAGFHWYENGAIRFEYYFNPKPNDLNLEYDQKHNLLKVERDEKVHGP